MRIVQKEEIQRVIVKREANSYKGDFGRLLLIGGTYPYGGAIIMAALAAVHSGAGLVTVATNPDNLTALHSHLPEAMGFDLADHELLPEAQLVFTPHQKEWEKLSGLDLASQTEGKSRRAVQNFPKGTVIVEKGPHTRIWTSGQDEGYQLDVGGPYQATGGMGDTLAGMIAGFAGQFPQVSLFERVAVATYLHSAIAEDLSKEAYVVLPTTISQEIPKWMKKWSDKDQVTSTENRK